MKINEGFDPSQPLVTEGYVCNEKGDSFKLQNVTLPPLSGTSIQVSISHVGLCHTDVHMRDNDWGVSDYPLCAGHEGVGIVTHTGSNVRMFCIGDRVGIAWIRDSCRNCVTCRDGRENICRNGYQGTYLGKSAGIWGCGGTTKFNEHGGCFSRIQRIEERFAVKIPTNLSPQIACPLLCGGATVYEPLVNHAPAGVGTRVGIMGLGGLGRCCVKLAKLRGCYTIVISTSKNKRDAAITAGADEFWCTNNDDDEEKQNRGELELIIDTRPVNTSVGDSMKWLGTDGVFCKVGIPKATEQGFEHIWIPHIFMQQSIVGSVVTGSKRIHELMEICSNNLEFIEKGEDVFPTEIISFSQINEGMKNLLDRKNKGYRYILEW